MAESNKKSLSREWFEFVNAMANLNMPKIDEGNRWELNRLEEIIKEAWKWSERVQLGQISVNSNHSMVQASRLTE